MAKHIKQFMDSLALQAEKSRGSHLGIFVLGTKRILTTRTDLAIPRKTPLFAFQSRFDADQQGCEMSRECRWIAACVKEYAGAQKRVGYLMVVFFFRRGRCSEGYMKVRKVGTTMI